MNNNKVDLANNDVMVKKKIVDHYDDLLPDDSLALHLGFYEKGIRTIKEAEFNMNNYVGKLLDLDSLNTTKGTILDAGCGVGGTSIYLAKKYPHIKFVGITLVPRQVHLANKFAREKDVSSNTEFIVGDYCETGLPSNSFDGVFALESSCYSIDKKRLVQEIARVLKSNGKFVVLDGFIPDEISNYFVQIAYEYYCDTWAVSNYIVLKEFLSNLKDAGFDNIEVQDITKNIFLFHFIGILKGLAYFLFVTLWKKQKEETKSEALHFSGEKITKPPGKNPFIYLITQFFSPVIIFLSRKFRYMAITCVKQPK